MQSAILNTFSPATLLDTVIVQIKRDFTSGILHREVDRDDDERTYAETYEDQAQQSYDLGLF